MNGMPCYLIPKDIVGSSPKSTFLKRLEMEPLKLSERIVDDELLSNVLIQWIGDFVFPPKDVKLAVNSVVLDNVRCLGVIDTTKTQLKIIRYYVCGDYSRKTAVGAYREITLITYVQFEGRPISEIINHLYEQLKGTYDYRRKRFRNGTEGLDDVIVCEVDKSDVSVIVKHHSLGPWVVKLLVADAEYAKHDSFMSIFNAYKAISEYTNPERSYIELRSTVQEAADRYVNSHFPQRWIFFIRFLKYWSSIRLLDMLPVDAVENIAIKLLLRAYPNFDENVDSLLLFETFLGCLIDTNKLNDLDELCLPMDSFNRSEDDPLIDWSSFTSYPKSSSTPAVTLRSLFHPTYNSVGGVLSSEWEAMRKIAFQCMNQDKSGIHLKNCFGYQEKRMKSTSSWWRHLINGLMVFNILMLMFLMIMLLWSLEKPYGTLSQQSFQRISDYVGNLWKTPEQWLKILPPSIEKHVQKPVHVVINSIQQFPHMWNKLVPAVYRRQIVMNRDFYGVKLQSWITKGYERFHIYWSLMRTYLTGK